MRKILSVLAAIGLTSTAATAVVACGSKDNAAVTKTNIATLFEGINLSIDGSAGMTADNAYALFLNIDGVSDILTAKGLSQNNFVLNLDFSDNYYTTSGALTLTVDEQNSEYMGNIIVVIKGLGQTNLQDATQFVKTIDGDSSMTTPAQALKAFLAIPANQELVGLIRAKEGDDSFVTPSYNKDGSLVIEAVPGNQAWAGEFTVMINKYQMDLGVLTKTIEGTSAMTAPQAFHVFLTANSDWEGLENSVDYDADGFVAPSFSQHTSGSLTITAKANTNFMGTIQVSITAVAKMGLNALNSQPIEGVKNMTVDQAFEEFLAHNQGLNLNDLKESVTLDFLTPNSVSGWLLITANPNTKYTGNTYVIITGLSNVIDEFNFTNVVKQISVANQLILHIPTGTSKGDGTDNSTYAQALKNSFIQLVLSFGWDLNLQNIVVDRQTFDDEGEAPSNTQLNSDYYDWHTTNGISIGGYMITMSGSKVNFEFHFLKCEIIIGSQK